MISRRVESRVERGKESVNRYPPCVGISPPLRARTHSSSECSTSLSLRFMLGLNFALPDPAVPPAAAAADGLNSLVLPSKPPTGLSRNEPDPGGPIEGVRAAASPTLGARVDPTPTEGSRRRLRVVVGPRLGTGLVPLPVPVPVVVVASLGASSVAAAAAALEDARDEVDRSGAGDGEAAAAVDEVRGSATVPARVCPPTRRPRPRPLPDMVHEKTSRASETRESEARGNCGGWSKG